MIRRFYIIAHGICSLVCAALCAPSVGAAQVTVVNVIPATQSGETNQDSEPNLAVNPANVLQIAASAFTPSGGVCGANLAPIFTSTNGGTTWAFTCIVPSDAAGSGTSDITLRFGGTSNSLYGGILRRPGFLRLNILRTNNFLGPAAMTVLVDRNGVDQPYIQAATVPTGAAAGTDRAYVGINEWSQRVNGGGTGQTASIDQSLNAGAATPPPPSNFTPIVIEARATGAGIAGQDGPPIRPAIHLDGTIYAVFYRWTAANAAFTNITTDVVVVRDDAWGTGATPFTALVEPPPPAGDGLSGARVVQGRNLPWAGFSQPAFGQERFVGSNLSIAVDPANSSTVYIAWADRVAVTDYTLHVRRSIDRGVTWSANDLRTITNATNPALAIDTLGTVGFLYQQLTGAGATQRWVTHLERTSDNFATIRDVVLANVPANAPPVTFVPYIGDYVHLMAVTEDFYGIFSANNTPNLANFPNGVTYQRFANFTTNTLLGTDGVTPVAISIDPFFFRVDQRPPIQDQVNTVVTGKSRGCGMPPGGLGSVFQSFAPSAPGLGAVDLRLREGGSFPAAGYTSTVRIRSGSPSGAVLGTTTTFVATSQGTGTQRDIRFEFLSPVPVVAGTANVIEWVSPPTGGVVFTWMAAEGDPYASGQAFGCQGTPITNEDFIFTTYSTP